MNKKDEKAFWKKTLEGYYPKGCKFYSGGTCMASCEAYRDCILDEGENCAEFTPHENACYRCKHVIWYNERDEKEEPKGCDLDEEKELDDPWIEGCKDFEQED